MACITSKEDSVMFQGRKKIFKKGILFWITEEVDDPILANFKLPAGPSQNNVVELGYCARPPANVLVNPDFIQNKLRY